MPYVPAVKDTLLIPSGITGLHLFAVITPRCRWDHHLIVGFSSIKPGRYYDPTCEIEAGVHSFIRVPSFIRYETARTVEASHLTRCVDGGSFVPREPIPDDWLKRICDGLAVSPRVASRIWNYYNGDAP
jgi:hypothetical protein